MVLESGVFWTGLVGLAGIGATIYGARQQTESTRAQVAVEREKQKVQHAEDHQRNRQTTYHLFLTAATRLRAVAADATTDEQVASADDRRWEFLHLLNGVQLFGTEPVRRAASALDEAIARAETMRVEIIEAPPGYVSDAAKASIVSFLKSFDQTAVAECLDLLLEAMRSDVAPPDT